MVSLKINTAYFPHHRQTVVLLVLLLCTFSIAIDSYAQDISGSLETHIDSIIDNLPGSGGGDFVEPTLAQRQSWEGIVSDILQGNYASASTVAASLNYQIIDYFDSASSQSFYILEEKIPQQNYWGTYVFNANACRTKLVIQSPHPKYDFNTGKEGVFCYQRLGALAFCLSGTHRCNSGVASSCSGTTSSCGSSAAFRVSDMPHSTDGMFQVTTSTINGDIPEATFIQLHGFSKQSTDPYVILSNGTRETPGNDNIPLITNGLVQADPSLTFKVAHLDTTWTRLIGFTNVQGRLLNLSPDPCITAATSTTGRFVHIEQEETKLREDSTGWYKMYQALASSFPCDSMTPVGIANQIEPEISLSPNPVVSELTIEGEGIESIIVYNRLGETVIQTGAVRAAKLDFSKLASGLYLVAIRSESRSIVRKIIKI